MSFRNVTEVRNGGQDFPLQRCGFSVTAARILRYTVPLRPRFCRYTEHFCILCSIYAESLPLQQPGFSVTAARMFRYSGKLGGGPEGWPRGSGGGGPEGWRITPSEDWRITPCDSHQRRLSSIAQLCVRGKSPTANLFSFSL